MIAELKRLIRQKDARQEVAQKVATLKVKHNGWAGEGLSGAPVVDDAGPRKAGKRGSGSELLEQMAIRCDWCNCEADPEKDGFHLVHVAFGSTQERYCFCGDSCYEAFRKLYPSRVHRNCYESDCADCSLCIKRYEDEWEGLDKLLRVHLTIKKLKGMQGKAKPG